MKKQQHQQLKRQQRGSCTGSTASGWGKSFTAFWRTSSLSLPPAPALRKPFRLCTWKKKSSTAVWLPWERSVSMATPSCRHSSCSCWKSTSAVYCRIRSFTMLMHSYRQKKTAFVKPLFSQHMDTYL